MSSKSKQPQSWTRREWLTTLALVPMAAACGSAASTSAGSDAGAGIDGGTDASQPGTCKPVGQGAVVTHGPFSGGATAISVRVSVRLDKPGKVNFQVTPAKGGTAFTSDCAMATAEQDFTVVAELVYLQPATEYTLVPVVDDVPQPARQIVTRTFAETGTATAFSFVFGSCCRYSDDGAPTKSNGKVFDVAMGLSEKPWFFAQIGDWTYPDYEFACKGKQPCFGMVSSGGDNFSMFESELNQAWHRRLTDKYPIRKLLAAMPIAYVWDDHDFAENNAWKGVKGKQADRVAAFARHMPSYPLAKSGAGVWQKFSAGHCDFFMVDMRSQRTDVQQAIVKEKMADGTTKVTFQEPPGHTLLGAEQLAWLLDGLKSSKALWKFVFMPVEINPHYDVLAKEALEINSAIILEQIGDTWSGFPTERDQILALHKSGQVKNIVFLTGDAHMAAMQPREPGCPPIFMSANLDISLSPIIDLAEQYGIDRKVLWTEWCQDSTGEDTIGRVRIVTEPKHQVVFESWGESGKLLHSLTIEAET